MQMQWYQKILDQRINIKTQLPSGSSAKKRASVGSCGARPRFGVPGVPEPEVVYVSNDLHNTLAEDEKRRLEKIMRSQMPIPAPAEEDEQPHELDWNIGDPDEEDPEKVNGTKRQKE